jgi:hypothetical protein
MYQNRCLSKISSISVQISKTGTGIYFAPSEIIHKFYFSSFSTRALCYNNAVVKLKAALVIGHQALGSEDKSGIRR